MKICLGASKTSNFAWRTTMKNWQKIYIDFKSEGDT